MEEEYEVDFLINKLFGTYSINQRVRVILEVSFEKKILTTVRVKLYCFFYLKNMRNFNVPAATRWSSVIYTLMKFFGTIKARSISYLLKTVQQRRCDSLQKLHD